MLAQLWRLEFLWSFCKLFLVQMYTIHSTTWLVLEDVFVFIFGFLCSLSFFLYEGILCTERELFFLFFIFLFFYLCYVIRQENIGDILAGDEDWLYVLGWLGGM